MARFPIIESRGGEGWLVSYCDMISLLVTFFLMMMTFSTREEGDLKEIGVGLLKGRGGIWPALQGSSLAEPPDRELVAALARDLAELHGADSAQGAFAFQQALDGLLVHFDLACAFEPGSADVPPALRESLKRLAAVLSQHGFPVVVEGSTDLEEETPAEFANARELATERATNAARILLRDSALAPELVQIASPGALRPRSSDGTLAGRASNRRVELRILSLSRPASARLERATDDLPDRPPVRELRPGEKR